jgi:hypothetical protein
MFALWRDSKANRKCLLDCRGTLLCDMAVRLRLVQIVDGPWPLLV